MPQQLEILENKFAFIFENGMRSTKCKEDSIRQRKKKYTYSLHVISRKSSFVFQFFFWQIENSLLYFALGKNRILLVPARQIYWACALVQRGHFDFQTKENLAVSFNDILRAESISILCASIKRDLRTNAARRSGPCWSAHGVSSFLFAVVFPWFSNFIIVLHCIYFDKR